MGPRAFARGNPLFCYHAESVVEWLQWGRALSRAETTNICHQQMPLWSFNGAARFRARKPISESTRSPEATRFNGAARFRARKRQDRAGHHDQSDASMGPRAFARGNNASKRRNK